MSMIVPVSGWFSRIARPVQTVSVARWAARQGHQRPPRARGRRIKMFAL